MVVLSWFLDRLFGWMKLPNKLMLLLLVPLSAVTIVASPVLKSMNDDDRELRGAIDVDTRKPAIEQLSGQVHALVAESRGRYMAEIARPLAPFADALEERAKAIEAVVPALRGRSLPDPAAAGADVETEIVRFSEIDWKTTVTGRASGPGAA